MTDASERERHMTTMQHCLSGVLPESSKVIEALAAWRADAETIKTLRLEMQKWREGTSAQRTEDVRAIAALENQLAAQSAELERVMGTLEHIAKNLSLSVPLGCDPESHYRGQLCEAIGAAARALTTPSAAGGEKEG